MKKLDYDVRKEIIGDLSRLHKSSNLMIRKTDDVTIRKIAAMDDGSLALIELESARLTLWLDYTGMVITRLDKLIVELSKAFVHVKEYRTELNKYKREYTDLKMKIETEKPSAESLKDLTGMYAKTVDLWNRIHDAEDDLRSDAWRNFLFKIYLPSTGAVEAAYLYIIFQTDAMKTYSNDSKLVILFVIPVVMYLLLKYIIHHPWI
jgi:hypothetical protein